MCGREDKTGELGEINTNSVGIKPVVVEMNLDHIALIVSSE